MTGLGAMTGVAGVAEPDGEAGHCRRMMEASFGKIPTTSVRRFTSLYNRFSGLVTGITSAVPMFGHGGLAMVYGATIRARGTGSTMVRAGRYIG